MRDALHSSYSAQGLSGAYPNVYFSDLAPPLSDSERCPASFSRRTLIASENIFEAAMQSAVLLQREALTITQRNVNRSFSLLKRFIGIRNFGTIVELGSSIARSALALRCFVVEHVCRPDNILRERAFFDNPSQ